jgi:hypothetical protein
MEVFPLARSEVITSGRIGVITEAGIPTVLASSFSLVV